MEPLVSVIVPVYNAQDSLEATAQSILGQTWERLELILVDDGSTDQSLALIQQLAADEKRIRWIHTANQGSGPARSAGIAAAVGDYLYFPDADDVLHPRLLETAVRAMEQHQADLVVFGFDEVDGQGRITKTMQYPGAARQAGAVRRNYSAYVKAGQAQAIQGALWNKLFSAGPIRSQQLRVPAMARHQDEAFIALYLHALSDKAWITFIPDVLYTYVQDGNLAWKKYPVDYFPVVQQLHANRCSTIAAWNPQDISTQALLKEEYVWGVCTAVELLFTPRSSWTGRARRAKVRDILQASHVLEEDIPPGLSGYRRGLLFLFGHHLDPLAFALMAVKQQAEQRGWVDEWKRRSQRAKDPAASQRASFRRECS